MEVLFAVNDELLRVAAPVAATAPVVADVDAPPVGVVEAGDLVAVVVSVPISGIRLPLISVEALVVLVVVALLALF